jgi:hypothetical protein
MFQTVKAKDFRFWLGLVMLVELCPHARATTTVLDDWRMGEGDSGAANGGYATNTFDSGVGNRTLANQPAVGVFPTYYPNYNNNVSGPAAFFVGSQLCEFYSTGQYAIGSVVPNLTTNFGIELWVYPAAGNGGSVIAYDGNTGGSGWGLYQAGTNCYVLFGGVGFSANSAPLATNIWTELALVCNVGVATLYTNGVAAFTMNSTPNSPAGSFLIGADNGGAETFSGGVDEVRVFTFAAGQFSPTNLLVNGPFIVTSTADSGMGSLRAAVAADNSSSTITFASALSGQTITLTNGGISLYHNVAIDASALAGGITINGNQNSQIFTINPNVVLKKLAIVNGREASGDGGGIYNSGYLSLSNCTLSGNSAYSGGGIYNSGSLTLNNCTLSGNSSHSGGGIYDNGGTSFLNNCTLSGNSSDTFEGYGGGIFNHNSGLLTLNNCTLSGNSAGYGGGIAIDSGHAVSILVNSIVAESSGFDIYASNGGVINLEGQNIVGFILATIAGPTPIIAGPQLAPLGNYGGPTPTMPPLPGSPAIDAADDSLASQFTADQRGYPRLAGLHVDIGAVEGVYNAAGAGVITGATRLGNGSFQFGFTNYEDMSFTAFAGTNLALPFNCWSNLGPVVETPAGSGQFQFTDPGATNWPQRFYRVSSP